MRILALAPYPIEAPSTRFRAHQYVAALASRGVELVVRPFLDGEGHRALRRGGPAAAGAVASGFERTRAAIDRDGWDAVLVQRGVAPFVDGLVLGDLRARGLPIVYDFDDAVYLPQEGGRRWVEGLRRSGPTTAAWCRAASVVLAGNAYLAEFALGAVGAGASRRVRVLPTVVDTERFVPSTSQKGGGRVRLGWVGSPSTLRYLERLAAPLRAVQERTGCRVKVVAGEAPPQLPGVDFEYDAWRPEDEVRHFQELDVGLYPLDDTPWARGKCGFKAIQYLACGVPCVASPVGVLRDIVRPGENGLHAHDDEAWVEACLRLLADPDTRRAMGEAGRGSVERDYSVRVGAPLLLDALRTAVDVA